MKKSLDWSKELGAQEDALVKHNTNGQHGQWQVLEKMGGAQAGVNQASGMDTNMAKKDDKKKDKHDFDGDGKHDEHEKHHKKLDEECKKDEGQD